MWSSRSADPDSTLAMPIVTSTEESDICGAMTTRPVTSVKRPRTFVTMKWRPTNARSVWPGSMSQTPGPGSTWPSRVRVGDCWIWSCDMGVLLSVMGVWSRKSALELLAEAVELDPVLLDASVGDAVDGGARLAQRRV